MQTCDPLIYALGDAVEIPDPILGGSTSVALAGPAVKQARVLTAHLARTHLGLDLQLPAYRGSRGAGAVKVFSQEVSFVGLSERALRQQGRACAAVWLHPTQHAGYYPDARACHLKLIYDPKSFEILGAQGVGAETVKRLEVISAYMAMHGSIDDLAFHEQLYAPPFSSARDGINYAGCVLENVRSGLVKLARFDELNSKFKDAFKLDVREPWQYAQRHIEGFVNIPRGQLRQRLAEIPRDKLVVVTCVVGIGAWNACRILQQHGFAEVYDLSGGVVTYFAATAGMEQA